MTSNAKTQDGNTILEGGPIPLNEAFFYVYPSDNYVWEQPSDGGSGEVGSRDFMYNTTDGTVLIGFGGSGSKRKLEDLKTTKRESSADSETVYFRAQAGDSIQLTDRSERYQVISKKISFDISDQKNPVARVTLTVEDVG